MSQTLYSSVTVIGIDIGKNSFHVVGQDARGAIVLRQKWSRGQIEGQHPVSTAAALFRRLERRRRSSCEIASKRDPTRETGISLIIRRNSELWWGHVSRVM